MRMIATLSALVIVVGALAGEARSGDVQTVEAIDTGQVIPIKADLTDRDAAGWGLLRSLHPVGAIPFTAVYLPGEKNPHKLAGIYTTSELLNVLNGAGASPAPVPAARSDRSSAPTAPPTADAPQPPVPLAALR